MYYVNSNLGDCCLHKTVTFFFNAHRRVSRPRENLKELKLMEIPIGASSEEVRKIQNCNYQKKWRFKQMHLKPANEIEE